jgi:hypothetical protein
MRRRIAFFACLLAFASVLAGCGDDEPDDYNADVEDEYLRLCEGQSADPEAGAVCQCAYDKFVEEIPFDQFQTFFESLQDDPNTTLPDEIVNLHSDCVLEQDAGSLTTPTLPTTTSVPGSTTVPPSSTTSTTVAP